MSENRPHSQRHVYKRSSLKKQNKRMMALFTATIVVAVAVLICAYPAIAQACRISASKAQLKEEAGEQETYDSVSVIRMKQPVKADDYVVMDGMRSKADVLIDADACKIVASGGKGTTSSGQEPYEIQIHPASMTKVLTLLTIVNNFPTDWQDKTYTFELDKLQYLVESLDASLAGFLSGETASAQDMLYGLILPSGADAAQGLVETFFDSQDDFVAKMNETAAQIGMTNSHFTNPYGMDDPELYSTPEDIARLFQYAMHNSLCEQVLTSKTYTTAPMSKHSGGLTFTSGAASAMDSTDNMPSDVMYVAGKTGFTESGYSIVTMFLKNGHHYICVAANADTDVDRNQDIVDMMTNYAK